MPDPLDDTVRQRMKRQRRRDTAPELRLRRELHRRGLRFRVDVAPVAGLRSRADIVFRGARVAVYVDGCFWHSCPEHGTIPSNNRDWWVQKLMANVARDERVDRQLAEAGWRSHRVWEHEDPIDAADTVEMLIRG